MAENFYAIGEHAAITGTNATTIARSDIVVPQNDVKDDDVQTDVADDVVASIDPPYAASSNFFGHLPQLELTSCTGE